MRAIVGGRAAERAAASRSEMARFETEILTSDENLRALKELSAEWIDQVRRRARLPKVILDMDSSQSPVHGEQEGHAYNGHFRCECYHPLFCFNQFGDMEGAKLRRGNVHSAGRWREVLEPIVRRYEAREIPRCFRADAAFAKPEIYEFLEEHGFRYAIRLASNDVLERQVKHLLSRPQGLRKGAKAFHESFMYQAKGWTKPRRVVAKVEWRGGELLPRVGFIVTNLGWRPKRVVKFYNKRGAAEQWIGEGKQALKWTRLSCHGFRANEVRLQLFVLAYNLANFFRRLALPRGVAHWSLTTLRDKVVKIGAKVVRHARYVFFQMAEVAVTRGLLEAMLVRIGLLRLAPA